MNKLLQTEKKLEQRYNNYKHKKNCKQKNKNGKYIFVYIFFLVLISIILVVYIGQSVKITHLNYKINKLEDNFKKVKNENHHLQLKLARNSSLAKVEQIARKDLNMREPEKLQIVVLDNKSNKKSSRPKIIKDSDNSIFFVFQIFDNFLEKLGTVKANSPD